MALAWFSSPSSFRRMANSSPPSRARASPCRRHDSRRRDTAVEQLVADQVAETVVDDLEAVEIEIQRGESAAGAPRLELVEAAPEPLHEDRAVAQPGQRVEEAGAAEPLLRDRLVGRVGQRSGDAGRAAAGASHRDTAAQEPPVGAVLVADPVLVLKVIRLCRQRCASSACLERRDVVGMDAVRAIPRDGRCRRARQADHRPPSARDVELSGCEDPLPQAVVGAFRRQREPLFASLERRAPRGFAR